MLVPAPAAIALRLFLLADGGAPGDGPEEPPRPSSLLAPLPKLRQPPPEDPYPLRPTRDGSGDLAYEERTFVARVARDGSVRFVQKREIRIHLFPPLPKPVRMGVPSLFSSLKALARGEPPPTASPPDDSTPPPETTTPIPEVTRYRPDPREGCRACGPLAPIYPLLTIELDLTDEIMRLNGQDPYRYQKAKFLVATRGVRTAMAAKAHAENIRRGRAALPARLLSIACDDRMSVGERRAILEALRAEMDTDTHHGHEAAETIQAFLVSRFAKPETCAR